MNISIEEKIKRQRGVTRYCNCDFAGCSHIGSQAWADQICSNNAVVVARVDGVQLQLCNECLQHARKA